MLTIFCNNCCKIEIDWVSFGIYHQLLNLVKFSTVNGLCHMVLACLFLTTYVAKAVLLIRDKQRSSTVESVLLGIHAFVIWLKVYVQCYL